MTFTTRRLVSLLLPALIIALLNFAFPKLALSGTFTSYGPETFFRGSGAPAPVVKNFIIPNPSTSYTLKIYNGGRSGIRTGERVSSAVISLNGVIVGPQIFNAKVSEISFPVKLLSTNQLSVELRSKPGSLIVIQIEGVDNAAPLLDFINPRGFVIMSSDALHELNVQYADPLAGLNLRQRQEINFTIWQIHVLSVIVTLSVAKGLAARFFASLRMTLM